MQGVGSNFSNKSRDVDVDLEHESGEHANFKSAGPVSSLQFDIGQLPIELAEEIMANVTSSRDLFNLCLVCKQFQEWARPQLYESVFLSSAEQIAALSSTLARNPGMGCNVRDLWMFVSIKRHEPPPAVFAVEEDSDDSEWTPEDIPDDDSGPGSCSTSESDQSDSDTGTENECSENDVDVPVHNVYPPNSPNIFPHDPAVERFLHFERTSIQPGPSTIPSSRSIDMHRPVTPVKKLWMDWLCPIITSESMVYGHAVVILGSCPSLRSLYLPWSDLTCLRALLPTTQLHELAIYRASDLRLGYGKFESISILMDLSSVQRLTIFDTTFQRLPPELSSVFPNLTHLRISLNVSVDMVASLSQYPRLTHLWFAPPQGDWHPQVDIEAFLLELQTQCPRIRRVRVDIPLGSTDAPQSFGAANWTLFPFVKVRSSMLRDTKSMWVYDLEYPFHDPPPGAAPTMYNTYAECLKHYWKLRLKGGGWDG